MRSNMTVTTQAMFNMATSRQLTVEDAVALLKNEMKLRTLGDKLEHFARGRNLRPLLVEGLCANHPDVKRESHERKVRDWFRDGERFIRKEDAIELCFILELNVEDADAFLAMIAEEGFHWRDPNEIVYIYALKRGLDYNYACGLHEQALELIRSSGDREQPAEDSFTAVVRLEVEKLDSDEALMDYLVRAAGRLGAYHNTAYNLFMEYMNLLETADAGDGMEDNSRMSTRDVVEAYFYRRFIPRFKRGQKEKNSALSAVQRGIWANWPEEVTISRMKNRVCDVTRKVMILLFLATDGANEDYDEDELLADVSAGDLFEDVYLRLNRMLEYCGFSRLDPRAPFDWMMLYCMCVEDIFDVDAQMAAFLELMFTGGDKMQTDE